MHGGVDEGGRRFWKVMNTISENYAYVLFLFNGSAVTVGRNGRLDLGHLLPADSYHVELDSEEGGMFHYCGVEVRLKILVELRRKYEIYLEKLIPQMALDKMSFPFTKA